jgi:hypothetical protein
MSSLPVSDVGGHLSKPGFKRFRRSLKMLMIKKLQPSRLLKIYNAKILIH